MRFLKILLFFLSACFFLELNISLAEEKLNAVTEKSYAFEKKIWYDNWDEGMEVAKRENKLVLIDFIKENCAGCVKMDKEIFPASEVKKRLTENWICIKINSSHWKKSGTFNGKNMNYYKLTRHFNVWSYPTLLFIDKKGEPFYIRSGLYDKNKFSALLDFLIEENNQKKLKLSYSKTNHYIYASFFIMIIGVMIMFIIIFKRANSRSPLRFSFKR